MIAAWSALLRLARRDARRHLGRTVLVMALIAVPVCGLVTAVTTLATVRVTPAEQVARALGSADIAVYPAGGEAVEPPTLPGARFDPIWRGELALDDEPTPVEAVGVDLTGLGAGMFEVVDGRAPGHAGEVAITAELAARLDLSVGDSATVADGPARVVGVLRDRTALDRETVVVAPAAVPASGYLVALPEGTSAGQASASLSAEGWEATTVLDVSRTDPGQQLLILVLGGFGFLLTGLVAAAAFAVSAQRRRHDLALLAASGADVRHLRRSVLASAIVLGAAGSVIGIGAGLAVSTAALGRMESWSNHAVDALHVPALTVAAVGALGFSTSVASSWLTARSAGRTPVAAALSGQRPPRTSSVRLLVIGLLCAGIGIAWTAIAAASAATTSEVLTALQILGASAVTMIGLGAISPWPIEQLANRFGHLMPVSVRLALRDTARYRSRTGPVVIAIVAALGLSIAVGATLESMEDGMARNYRAQLGPNQLLVDGPAPAPLVDALREDLPVTSAAPYSVIQPTDPSSPRPLPQAVTVADDRLLTTLGGPPDAADALADGHVVVLYERGSTDTDALVAEAQMIAPGEVHEVGLDFLPRAVPPIVLTRDTLDAAGAEAARGGTRWLVELAAPPSDAQLADAQHLARNFGQRLTVETGPAQIGSAAIQSVATLGAGVFSLLIVAVGLALITTETAADDALIAAVGGSPETRRATAAARAATLTVTGAVLAIPAGVLPIWGLTSAIDATEGTGPSLPWATIGVGLVVVPVLASAAAWLLTRGNTSARAGLPRT